ncbi:MAG: hypothetical protein IT172_03700 [Acidobacteria bacterium]|nr:hypothetical protein [Acidobacteriota bacterium]
MFVRIIPAFILAAILSSCAVQKNTVNTRLDAEMPRRIIWAWERPEDLSGFDPKEFGVAFLAQTLFLENGSINRKPRMQPLETADGAYIIAVTRIETNKSTAKRPTLDEEMAAKTAALIAATRTLPNVRGVQVDFDAVVSERDFYRKMMFELRRLLSEPPASAGGQNTGSEDTGGNESVNDPTNTHHSPPAIHPTLTMTSLASWCTGDAWFNDFPVDEAVPMAFQMGADTEKIRTYLRNGNDWIEPLCRGSYGISLDEGLLDGMKPGRRIYYFKNSAWKQGDLSGL